MSDVKEIKQMVEELIRSSEGRKIKKIEVGYEVLWAEESVVRPKISIEYE